MERSRLAQLRMQKGWSLVQAATRIGVSVNTLNRWELGAQTPYGYNLQKLSAAYSIGIADLGIQDTSTSTSSPHTPLLAAFIANDPSMRLLTLALTPHRDHTEVQAKVSLILEDFDAMNIDPMTRREALKRLAALAVAPFPVIPNAQQSPDTLMNQYAAGIAACQELGRGKDVVDLALAFEGASALLERLEPIIRDSTRQRKVAATLAAQAARLQTVLIRHLQGASVAIHYGQQAVLYSKETNDLTEHLITLIFMATAYSYVPQHTKQALDTMEQAVMLLKERHAKVPLYIHGQVYSTLAVMQAKNGLSGDDAFRHATKNVFADQGYAAFLDDPVVMLIGDEWNVLHHSGEHSAALTSLSQLIDVESADDKGDLLLTSKRAMSEREHLGVLSRMTLTSLKKKSKELERSVSLWKAQMQVVKALKSEQRFEEAVFAYHLIDALWGDDIRVKELRPLTIHW